MCMCTYSLPASCLCLGRCNCDARLPAGAMSQTPVEFRLGVAPTTQGDRSVIVWDDSRAITLETTNYLYCF